MRVRLNSSGMSLIEVMIGLAIMGVVTAGMVAMLDQGNRGTLSLQQKIEVLQVQQDVFRDLGEPTICGCNFDPTKNLSNGSPLTFDSTNLAAASITLSSLYATCVGNVPGNPIARTGLPLSPAVPSVVVSRIRLAGITATGAGGYRGDIQIEFDPDKMILLRKPAHVTIGFQVDATIPTQTRILGCSTSVSGAGGSGGGTFECPPLSVSPVSAAYTLPRAPLGAYIMINLAPGNPDPFQFIPAPPTSCGMNYYKCGITGPATAPTTTWVPQSTTACEPSSGA